MKINKACDLSSISVLPPHSRRRSGLSCSLPEMSSTLGHSQPQSKRQQLQSQQSFSQGISSQHNAIFSQFSQNSQDETLTNDQLIVSEERKNSVKRFSCLPQVNHTREESRMPISRSSSALIRKWGSGVSERKCHVSEELEHRLGTIESSVSKFGLMLESLQTDIMQVNKGTKEVAMDIESIRQKLIANDNSLQTINKGQEDVKSSLHGELKLISAQLNQEKCQQNSQDTSILLSNLQEKIGGFILNLRNDLSNSFTNELQAMGCKLKLLDQKKATPTVLPSQLTPTVLPPRALGCKLKLLDQKKATPTVLPSQPTPTVLPPRAVSFCANSLGIAPPKYPAVPPKVQLGTRIPKVKMGTWNSVKREHASLTNRDYSKGHKPNSASQTELGREMRIDIESDEDIEGGFAFFSEENGAGKYSIEKAKEESEHILRKARRRKRKHCNTIIIN